MIPNADLNDGIEHDFEIEEMTSYTPRLNPDTYRIEGFVDGIEAVKQAIYLILYVERYEWVIYSWNHGIELKELFGKSMYFVVPEVERRIKEALMQDDRINDVYNFDSQIKGSKLTVSFTVDTIFGEVDETFKEVF